MPTNCTPNPHREVLPRTAALLAAVRRSLSAYGNPDRYGYTQFCYPVNQYTEAQKPSLFKVRQVAANKPTEGL